MNQLLFLLIVRESWVDWTETVAKIAAFRVFELCVILFFGISNFLISMHTRNQKLILINECVPNRLSILHLPHCTIVCRKKNSCVLTQQQEIAQKIDFSIYVNWKNSAENEEISRANKWWGSTFDVTKCWSHPETKCVWFVVKWVFDRSTGSCR